MKPTILWIDREHAKIFEFSEAGMEQKKLQAHRHDHHLHPRDNQRHQTEEVHFFPQIVEQIKDATDLVIVGPGVARYHFQTYLAEHSPSIARKILACESADHPTDKQMIALAKQFFPELDKRV